MLSGKKNGIIDDDFTSMNIDDNGVVYQEWCKQRIVSGIWSNIQSSLIIDNNLVNLSKRATNDGENYHNILINRVR